MKSNNKIFVSRGNAIDNNSLWMVTNDTDILCHFDFETMELKEWHVVPTEILDQYAHGLLKFKKNLYLIPNYGKEMFIYKTEKKEFEKVEVPFGEEANKPAKFVISTGYANKIFMVGHNIEGIYCYDECNKSFIITKAYLKKIKKYNDCGESPYFSDCYVKIGKMLYIPLYHRSLILIFDMESLETEVVDIGENIYLKTIDYIGDDRFFLTTCNDERLLWSREEGVQERRTLDQLIGQLKIYDRAFYEHEKYYYIASCERKVFVEKGGIITELPFSYDKNSPFTEGTVYTQFEAIFRFRGSIFFQARSNGQLYKIDTLTDIISEVDFSVPVEEKKKIKLNSYKERKKLGVAREDDLFDLSNFIKSF